MRNQMVACLFVGVALLTTSGCGRATAACFVPSDQTAGWKSVAIPPAYPSLAAPNDVNQFRTGEAAIVWEDKVERSQDLPYYGGYYHHHYHHAHHGEVQEVTVRALGDNARHLDVELGASLHGMRVEVNGWSSQRGTVPLLSKRLDTSRILLEWQGPLDSITLTFHSHLRHDAVTVRRVRVGERRIVETADWASNRFAAPKTLYFFHPGGRTLELCEREGATLGVERASVTGLPMPVELKGTLASVRSGMVRDATRAVTGGAK